MVNPCQEGGSGREGPDGIQVLMNSGGMKLCGDGLGQSGGRCLRLLVVVPRTLEPDHTSGEQRMFRLLRLLALELAVDLGSLDGEPVRASHLGALEAAGVRCLPPGRRGVLGAMTTQPYSGIWCEFWGTAHLMSIHRSRIQPWARLIVDSVDVHFVREEAGLDLGYMNREEVERRKHSEIGVYQTADAVVVVSAEDRAALDQVGIREGVHEIPNIIEGWSRPAMPREPVVLFVGGFDHPPNRDAVFWFAENVFPLIRTLVPAAKWAIVGSRPPEDVRALGVRPGIEVVGYVPETRPYLDRAAVSVAPLRYGGGMKGKVTEAMSAGVPVVTTSFGAQGLNAAVRRHLLIADKPWEFASMVAGLLNNPDHARELGEAGQSAITDLCGEARVRDQLRNLVNSLRPAPGGFLRRLRMSGWRLLLGLRDILRRDP